MTLHEVRADNDLAIYFNWSANALLPVYHGAADRYMTIHRETVVRVAQRLTKQLQYKPGPLYRGIILPKQVTCIEPHKNLQYLSFSEDINVARHFANFNGIGSDIVDLTKQLGTFGYVIEYSPQQHEILFHHALLELLPYREAFDLIGLNGAKDIAGLKRQKEIMIMQPAMPLVNVEPFDTHLQTTI